MFLSASRSYTGNGQQRATGAFLWIVLPDEAEETPCTNCESPVTSKRWGERYCCRCGKTQYDKLYHPPLSDARAFVRRVTLKQLGHWMMGEINVGRHRATISGTYGCDGLPATVARHVWAAGLPVPEEITTMWANSTSGHNSAGDEGRLMHAWGVDNIKDLRRAGRGL